MVLNLALSYGSRQEILRAVRAVAEDYKSNKLSKKELKKFSQEDFSKYLYTADLPEPDLMIRTGGDIRISNFLLWQMAYTEMYFTETLWPDFTINELHEVINVFSSVERRFGLEKSSKKIKTDKHGASLC